MQYAVGAASNESLIPRLNWAIGPSCPVRCVGCYNHFGEAGRNPEQLVSLEDISAFAIGASQIGITRSIVSGGDPLTHPDILSILASLTESMDHVRLDTVGSALLPNIGRLPIVFMGSGTSPAYSARKLKDKVSLVNIPLDGAEETTAQLFRHGRRGKLVQEAQVIASEISAAGIPLGFNTVVHNQNKDELEQMARMIRSARASQWRLFEFDPTGPNNPQGREDLVMPYGLFGERIEDLRNLVGDDLEIFAGSLENRGTYHMINDSGILYERVPGHGSQTIGHIGRDREEVLSHLQRRISEYYNR